jgi:DNA-binding MarR family transcriptional regulator
MKKIDVLNLLSAEPHLDAATISGSLDGTPEATGMLLVRLVRQGLLCREIDDRRFVYTLTAKGEARRRHLNTNERELTG